MAYETTKSGPSIMQRVAQGLSGAMEGAGKVINWSLQLQHAQQQQAMMQQNMQKQQQEMQQKQAEMFDVASKQQSGIMETALSSDDPEAAMNSNKEAWDRWSKYGSIKTPFEDAVTEVKNGSKLVKPYQKQINEAIAVMGDPNISFDKKRASYSVASTALEKAKATARNNIFITHFGTQKTIVDTAYQEASKQEHLNKRAQMEATAKATTNTGKAITQDTKNVDNSIDMVTGAKGSTTALGKALTKLQVSGDLQTNLKGIAEGRIIPNDQVETQIAAQLGQLETGGQRMAWDMVKHFMTKNAFKTTKQLLQYISSKPTSTITQDFLQQYQSISDRQDEYYKGEVSKGIEAQKSKLKKVFSKDSTEEQRFDEAIKNAHPWYGATAGGGKNEVTRMTKDGKKAVFDASTKQFLRYAE